MTDALFNGALISGAVVGLIAAFWTKFKALLWRFVSFFVVRFTVEDEAAPAVARWLWKHGKRSRFGEKSYSGAGLFVKPADRHLLVAWEKIGMDAAVFWIGRRPIVAAFTSTSSGNYVAGPKLTLTFLRGTFRPDEMVRLAVEEMNARRHGDGCKRYAVQRFCGTAGRRNPGAEIAERTKMYRDTGNLAGPSGAPGVQSEEGGRRVIGWSESDIGAPSPPDPLGPLAFPKEVDDLVQEARQWLTSERWYKDRRIPWRRGWLLYGSPGTGKTSLARAVAIDIDLKIFVFELATMDDEELISFWQRALAETPCMILLEDIDTVFKGRDNRLKDKGNSLSFGCLLNCISGVEGADGILLVVTTNKLEDVDSALGVPGPDGLQSTRPGRVDRALELKTLDQDCRRKVALRILADCLHEVEAVVRDGDGDSGAQFQERCTRVALAWRWSNTKPANEPLVTSPVESF